MTLHTSTPTTASIDRPISQGMSMSTKAMGDDIGPTGADGQPNPFSAGERGG